MNKIYYTIVGVVVLFTITVFYGCKKDWLEAKANAKANVPTTLKDVQELLNRLGINGGISITPGFVEASSDNCKISNTDLAARSAIERNHYLWKQDCYEGSTFGVDWSDPYKAIYQSNLCLDVLDKIKVDPDKKNVWQTLKGQALFFRASSLFALAQSFCKAYDLQSSATDLGLPIPLTADINVNTQRLSLQQTYDQIVGDLSSAVGLINVIETERNTFMPGKAAAEGMLARVYLAMRNYNAALQHSEASLMLYDKLNNFNNLNLTVSYPFVDVGSNVEILSCSRTNLLTIIIDVINNVPDEVYQLYDDQDIRKAAYFKSVSGGIRFRGGYSGSRNIFTGLGTDEVFLINAECKVRLNDVSGGILRLNQLLRNRYNKNSNGGKGFQDYVITDPIQALDLILTERRKELFFRGLRWSDLKRLNFDSRYAKTITHTYNGKTYSLVPNDMNYALQIPSYETTITPNPRHEIVGQ